MNAPVVSSSSRNSQDTRIWENDHLRWRRDVESWQHDLRGAVSQLEELTEVVLRHGESLELHLNAIDRHEQQALADRPGEYGQLSDSDNHSSRDHRMQEGLHCQIERNHRVLMAHLAMMKSAIEASNR